jgi:hypothetical protein
MNPIGNFPKNLLFFCSKAEKHHRLCLTYVLKSFALFFGDFRMDIYSVDSNEALNDFFSALNASLPLIFMGKYRLTLHRHYFLK